MFAAIFLILVGGFIAFTWIDSLKGRYPHVEARFLKVLYFYHVALTFAYYGYALFNRSDSRNYYGRVVDGFRGDGWFSYYGTSTTFIEFIAYPFIEFFGFSYEAAMVLFSLFGFWGFVYFYIFFKENIRFRHTFLGYDLLTITFFLPNLHFWSSSLGKGSIIFLGLGLFFFGISNIQKRYLAVIIGGLIVYHVRPHVMLVVLVSTTLGFIFSNKQMGVAWRLAFLIGATAAFFYIYRDVLALVGIDEEGLVTEGFNLSHRAQELSKATSGVNISQYSLPMQVFTFLYRPLFFDAPGLLGYLVSFENVFYLLVTFRFVGRANGISYLFSSGFLPKSAFLSFITITVALAQIAGNLGLAMRQKSQVMILFLFVILSFLDEMKRRELAAKRKRVVARQLSASATGTQVRWQQT